MSSSRIKELRKQCGYTQVDLAEKLGVGPSTIAMWETGKRTPSFKLLNDLSDLFDKTTDYILGYSDDDHSMKRSDEDIEQLGRWVIEEDCRKLIKDYMSLDDYGKAAVENLVQMERLRCMSQCTLVGTQKD